MPSPQVRCLYCGALVRACDHTYPRHGSINRQPGTFCPLSFQRIPSIGNTEYDWVMRAKQVADLAWQLHDGDPAAVWAYLGVLSDVELKRLAVIALAGIPVPEGKRVEDMFAWVTELPAAQRIPA